MPEIPMHTALAEAGGTYYVFTDLMGTRGLLKSEKPSDDHPFIKFVNAQNLPEFMIALDEIYEIEGHTEFISDLAGGYRPSAVSPSKAADFSYLFNDRVATTTMLEKTKEALEVWDFDKMELSEDSKSMVNNGLPPMYLCTPLDDILRAKEDLRKTALFMAWLLGKMSFSFACHLTEETITGDFEPLNFEGDSILAQYYSRLGNAPGNEFLASNAKAAMKHVKSFSAEAIESTVRMYVGGAFGLLLSDNSRKMLFDLTPYDGHSTILAAMWSFFADGLDQEEGPGSIAVCKQCGKFYQRKRQTKRFCNDSCRVMYQRKHAGEEDSNDKPVETETMRMRARRRGIRTEPPQSK